MLGRTQPLLDAQSATQEGLNTTGNITMDKWLVMRHGFTGLALIALLVVPMPATAQQARQLSADPNFSLEIRFTVPHPLTPLSGGDGNYYLPDMIMWDLNHINIISPVGSHSAYLFDGATQLGVVTNSLLGDVAPHYYLELGAFQTATSQGYNGPNRNTVIDFSSIYDGTIDGRLLFTISQGSFDIPLDTHVGRSLGIGRPGIIATGDDYAAIVSMKLIALDPAQALDQLGTEVSGVGPGKKLANAVRLAQTYYAEGDTEATCAVLTDFVYQVDDLAARKRPKLTLNQASKLNSHAEGIMTGIGCN